ncbi:MAG: hypothetical protein ACYTXY_46635, partial [Nostoc sp.]
VGVARRRHRSPDSSEEKLRMRSLPPLASLPSPSHQQRREKINHRNVPPLNQARKLSDTCGFC